MLQYFLHLCILFLKINQELSIDFLVGGWGIIFLTKLFKSTVCYPLFLSDFCRIIKEILEGVTYFLRASLNPLRIKPVFPEVPIVPSPWRPSSGVTCSHAARASLDSSPAWDPPASLASTPRHLQDPHLFSGTYLSVFVAGVRQIFVTSTSQGNLAAGDTDRVKEWGDGGRRAFGISTRLSLASPATR